jgi:flagellin-like protein
MKGISPLLSAVLLIAIVVSMSLIVGQWSSALSQQRSSQISNQTEQRLSCQFANLYVKNVTFFCNNNCLATIRHTINISVVNSGKRSVQIESFALRNTTGNISIFRLNETKDLQAGSTFTSTNVTFDSCVPFNNTIDRVIVSSINCPANAYDSFPGSSVAYAGC